MGTRTARLPIAHWPTFPLTPHIEICTLSPCDVLATRRCRGPGRCRQRRSAGAKGDSPIFVASCRKNRDSPRAACQRTKLPNLPMQHSPQKYKSTYDVAAGPQLASPHRLRATRNTQADATASRWRCIGAGDTSQRVRAEDKSNARRIVDATVRFTRLQRAELGEVQRRGHGEHAVDAAGEDQVDEVVGHAGSGPWAR